MAKSIVLTSKGDTVVGENHRYVLALDMQEDGKSIPCVFLQTDECSAALVAVTAYGGVIIGENSDTTDSIKISAIPLSTLADATTAVEVTLTVAQLVGTSVGSAISGS